MIKPHKYMNLSISVLRISALILRELMQKRIICYMDLYNKLEKKIGNDLLYIFPLALSFLYIQKAVIYHTQTDSFEYVERRM